MPNNARLLVIARSLRGLLRDGESTIETPSRAFLQYARAVDSDTRDALLRFLVSTSDVEGLEVALAVLPQYLENSLKGDIWATCLARGTSEIREAALSQINRHASPGDAWALIESLRRPPADRARTAAVHLVVHGLSAALLEAVAPRLQSEYQEHRPAGFQVNTSLETVGWAGTSHSVTFGREVPEAITRFLSDVLATLQYERWGLIGQPLRIGCAKLQRYQAWTHYDEVILDPTEVFDEQGRPLVDYAVGMLALLSFFLHELGHQVDRWDEKMPRRPSRFYPWNEYHSRSPEWLALGPWQAIETETDLYRCVDPSRFNLSADDYILGDPAELFADSWMAYVLDEAELRARGDGWDKLADYHRQRVFLGDSPRLRPRIDRLVRENFSTQGDPEIAALCRRFLTNSHWTYLHEFDCGHEPPTPGGWFPFAKGPERATDQRD